MGLTLHDMRPGVLFCVCPRPAYGGRYSHRPCRRCTLPPLAHARARLGLTTKDPRWAST